MQFAFVMRSITFTEFNKVNIQYTRSPLSRQHIEDAIGRLSKPNISRICFHRDHESDLHVMLITIPKMCIYPTHRHNDTSEWYQILHGSLIVNQFDLDNPKTLINTYELSMRNSSLCQGMLVPVNTWHQTVAGNGGAVFLETRRGPFDKSMTIFSGD